MSPPKKKAKFRNVSRKGKTFDGYEKEFLPMFSFDNQEAFSPTILPLA